MGRLLLIATAVCIGAALGAVAVTVADNELLPYAFAPLPTGAVKPTGWLKTQLQTQAQGLSGHLSLFWADINQSSWIGGNADGGLHERTPYWLNGFVPLAYQLDDEDLQKQVHFYVEYVLAHQGQDGWLGPTAGRGDGNCYWSRYPMMLALLQYYEATNFQDKRIIPAIMKYLHCAQQDMTKTALAGWSAARYQDMILTLHWLIDHNATTEKQFLWDLAETAHQQGFDWKGFFDGSSFPTQAVTQTNLYTHGVNNGQAIKSEGVWYRQSRNTSDLQSCYTRLQRLDQYHGMPSGIFSADEHLAGLMPSRGTELCAVVEAMYSYEVLFSVTGDPIFAERAEKIAYNALPATFTKDMWAHQYLQQPNEMNAIHSDQHVWTHDGPDSTLYGLAPNYGCCTANFNQGWPKYVSHLVMSSPDGGMVVSMWAPCSVTSGSTSLTITTDYPFGDSAELSLTTSNSMPLYLRIPSWAEGTTVNVNGGQAQQTSAGKLFKVMCEKGKTTIDVKFAVKIRVERHFNNAAAILRGALLYGLHIGENYTTLRSYEFDSKDYQVTPLSPWNYALSLPDDTKPEESMQFHQNSMPTNITPFHIPGVPVMITAKGQILPGWGLSLNAAAAPPQSPVAGNGTKLLDDIMLLPFGSTCLRTAELPTLKP